MHYCAYSLKGHSDENCHTIVATCCVAFVLISAPRDAFTYNATGNENRCEALGVNCICSEPLNTETFVTKGNQYSLDPLDTTAKECEGFDGVPGGVIVGNNNAANPVDFIVADNNSDVLAALPAGNELIFYVRGAQDNIGSSFAVFMIGHRAGSSYTKRLAWRYLCLSHQ